MTLSISSLKPKYITFIYNMLILNKKRTLLPSCRGKGDGGLPTSTHSGDFCPICGQKSKKSDLRYLSHLKFILAYETMTNQDPKVFLGLSHLWGFWTPPPC